MFRLLDLPSELLPGIVGFIAPDDIVAFASSCSLLKNLTEPRLEKHRAMIRDVQLTTVKVGFDTLGLWNSVPSLPALEPLLYLKEILIEPFTRYYCNTVYLGGIGDNPPFNEDEMAHVRNVKAKNLDYIMDNHEEALKAQITKLHAVLSPPNPQQWARHWRRDILLGKDSATVVLLLALYHNLETLEHYSLGDEWGVDNIDCLKSMVRCAMSGNVNDPPMLHKLSTFILKGGHEPYNWADGSELWYFLALPLMQKIVGTYVLGRDCAWSHGASVSNITELDLRRCDIDTSSLEDCLQTIKALQRFTFIFKKNPEPENSDPPQGQDSDWEPSKIVAALKRYASKSLAYLALMQVDKDGTINTKGQEPYIGSLSSFEALKDVRVYGEMVIERVGDPEDPDSLVENEPRRLVSILPRSIRKVQLAWEENGGSLRDDMRIMFSNFSRFRLPHLHTITIETTLLDELTNIEQARSEFEGESALWGVRVRFLDEA